MKKVLKNDKLIITIALFCTFSITAFVSKGLNRDASTLFTLGKGLTTCFLRVNQSYTAKLLGGNPSYLSESFTANTESCFADVLFLIENSISSTTDKIFVKANKLSSDIHWFSGDLTGNGNTNLDAINQKFTKLEGQKNSISELIETRKEKLSSSDNYISYVYYILFALTLFTMGFIVLEKRRKVLSNLELETEALDLINEDELNTERAENIILDALSTNDLENCSELYKELNNRVLKDKAFFVSKKYSDTMEEKVEDKTKNNKTEEELLPVTSKSIDRVEPYSKTKIRKKSLTIDSILADTVDGLASKIFSSGVIIDLNIESGLTLDGNKEMLSQSFYHSFVYLMSLDSKKINISSTKLGDTAIIDFISANSAFEQNEGGSIKKTLEHTLLKELIKDCGGKIAYSNVMHSSLHVKTARIRIVLGLDLPKEKAGENTSKLISLKTGKKKDIMRELKAEA